MQKTPIFIVTLLVASGLAAGCTTPAPSSSPSPSETARGDLKYVPHPVLGEVLADPSGRVLYVFTNDNPNASVCYGACATNWPPFLENATPGAPADTRAKLSLVDRTDGSTQVAYRGRPLYYFAGDTAGGDAKGDGIGSVWFLVRRAPADPAHPYPQGASAVANESVNYFQDVTGYYAHPTGASPKTGIVMIHEWWGLNDNIRSMARVLASEGYAVLAVDLFHGHVATTAADAQAQVNALNQDEATQNMRAAAAFLKGHNVTQVAGLGWCFGGGQSLQLALSGETLVATVMYYGFVVTDDSKLAPIHWPVLAIYGENDTAIPPSMSKAFDKALTNRSIEHKFYLYPDVGHAFANPTGTTFAPEETADAWARTLAFLKLHAPPN